MNKVSCCEPDRGISLLKTIRQFVEPFLVTTGQTETGSTLSQRNCDRSTDSTASSCDEGQFILEHRVGSPWTGRNSGRNLTGKMPALLCSRYAGRPSWL